MRHRQSRRRLRYKPAHSRSLQRNLVTSLLLYESIRTTKKRAEVIRPLVDRIITTARTKAPHVAIRSINAVVTHKNACRKTMEVLKPRYASRTSGFTRMVPLGSRFGDGAEVVTLELMDAEGVGASGASDKNPTRLTGSGQAKPKNPKSIKKAPSVSSVSSDPSVSSKKA